MQVVSARWLDAGKTMLHVEFDDGAQFSGPTNLAAPYGAVYEAWSGATEDFSTPSVDLPAYAANARWLKEVGGLTFGGMAVATDDRSKLLISGARQGADADPTFTTPFATAGTVTTLNATQIIALSNAVLAHVRDCFSVYSDVVKGMAAGTIKTPADVDGAFAAMTD